jgi:hypothetical protein
MALAVAAHSQNVKYYLAYGDATCANQNARLLNDELRTDVATNLVGLSYFNVRVVAEGVAAGQYAAGGLMITLDTGVTNGTGSFASKAAFDSAAVAKILSLDDLLIPNLTLGSNMPGLNSSGAAIQVNATPISAPKFSGSLGDGNSLRPIGLWANFGFGIGNTLNLQAGSKVVLADLKLSVNQAKLALQPSATYSELGIFGYRNGATRTTFLGPTNSLAQGSTKLYSITSKTKKHVSGKIILDEYFGAYPSTVTFEFLDPYTFEVFSTVTATLGPGNTFDIECPANGEWYLGVKYWHWLRQVRGINTTNNNVVNQNIRLLNGDCDGDNYVSTDDYLLLSGAFDTIEGDPLFVPEADLDGTGYVNTDDYLILSDNFDIFGD